MLCSMYWQWFIFVLFLMVIRSAVTHVSYDILLQPEAKQLHFMQIKSDKIRVIQPISETAVAIYFTVQNKVLYPFISWKEWEQLF